MHGILHNIEKYGKIVGFYIGSKPFVVVADFDMIKELLKRDEFAGRPATRPICDARPGYNSATAGDLDGRPPGVLLSQGSYWREQRRFLLRNLRDFGFGKRYHPIIM